MTQLMTEQDLLACIGDYRQARTHLQRLAWIKEYLMTGALHAGDMTTFAVAQKHLLPSQLQQPLRHCSQRDLPLSVVQALLTLRGQFISREPHSDVLTAS